MEPELALETITPEVARQMLVFNTKNRRVNPEHVTYLSGVMQRGEWVVNGETIAFADDGSMLDGQHRLLAVIDSSVSIETLVMRNLSAAARDVTDTQMTRRLSDQLAIEGYERTIFLASAVNNLHRFTGAEIRQGLANKPSPHQALRRLTEAPELQESVALVSPLPREIGFGPVGVLATMHFLFRRVDPAPTEDFFGRLLDGVGLSRGDPVLHLRNRFITESRKARRHRELKPHNVAYLTIVAFNHRRAGTELQKLRARSNDPFPEILPPGVIERQRGSDHFRHHHAGAEDRETIWDRVRTFIDATEGPVSPKDVTAALDPPAPASTVNSMLWLDARDGRIQKVGRGLYQRLPDSVQSE